jgi:uncharacterized protein YegP (UPF0339 family)
MVGYGSIWSRYSKITTHPIGNPVQLSMRGLDRYRINRKHQMTKFIVFRSPINEQWYFHFLAANGKILAQSEGYQRQSSVTKAIKALKAGAGSSPVIVRTDGLTKLRKQ